MRKAMKTLLALTLVVGMMLSFAAVSVNAYELDNDGYIKYEISLGGSTLQSIPNEVLIPVKLNETKGFQSGVLLIYYDGQYLNFRDRRNTNEDLLASVTAANYTNASDPNLVGTKKAVKVVFYADNPNTISEQDATLFNLRFDVVNGPVLGQASAAFSMNAAESNCGALKESEVGQTGLQTKALAFGALNGTTLYFGEQIPGGDPTVSIGSATTFAGDEYTVPVSIKDADKIAGGVQGSSLTVSGLAHQQLVGIKAAGEANFTPIVAGNAATPTGLNANQVGSTVEIAWTDLAGAVVYNAAAETAMFELKFKAADAFDGVDNLTLSDVVLAYADGAELCTTAVTVDGAVTVQPLQVSYVAPSAAVTLEEGTTAATIVAQLPSEVTVELSALTAAQAGAITTPASQIPEYRKTAQYPVVWDTTGFNPSVTTAQTLTGTITIPAAGSGVANAASLTASVSVTVPASTGLRVTAAAIAVPERIVDLGISEATALAGLAQTATVTLSDNSTITVPVTWTRNAADLAANGAYDATQAGSFVYDGVLDLSGFPDVANPNNIVATATIVVSDQYYLSEVQLILKYLVGLADISELNVAKLDVNATAGIDIGDAVAILKIIDQQNQD